MSTRELTNLKLVVLGDIEAGKTCLLAQYTGNPITQPSATVGIDLFCKNIAMDDIMFKAKIWDTAGTEKYRSINRGFYKGALGVLLVFDISKEIMKSQLDEWEKELKNIIANPSVVVVGNKVDIGVNGDSQKLLQQYCKEHRYQYIETSAKNGSNVEEAFTMLISGIDKSKDLRKVLKQSSESFVLSIASADFSYRGSTFVNSRPCQC